MSAPQYGMEPNEFAKAVDEAGQVPAMVAEVARRKALAVVLEKAKVIDADGNEVDLEELTPRSTTRPATRATTTRARPRGSRPRGPRPTPEHVP